MQYPRGRCDRCGGRMYAQITGGDRCPNCDRTVGHSSGRTNRFRYP